MDDVDIVLLMMDGDPEGVRLLLREYGGKVKAGLRCEFSHVLAEPEIDEAINWGAFKAFKAAQSYNEAKGSLRTWFYSIARNAARDILRGEERHATVPLEYDPLWYVDVVEVDDNRPVEPKRDKLLRDLIEAVEALPKLQKAIIKADLACGKADANRLAQEYGTTVNAVYVSRSHAIKRLREAMRLKGHHMPSGMKRRTET